MSTMATKKAEVIEIRPVNMQTTTLKIVGDTPLIVHRWSFKALMEMLGYGSALSQLSPVFEAIKSVES